VADSLDAGLAAGFAAPRSSLGDRRPVLLKEAEGDSAHVVKPKSDAMPPPEQTGDRYQLQGEIARGGMGAVLRGRDVDLGRDLAVKVLLEKHAHRPEVARRFIEEAQIGGQLQHPGVVPVYDVGRFGDRPFFTMKLVKGQTLQALLAERAEPSVDRPRFLAVALQVAQTLAYAHAKGVIHRDLKPANIMVGAFGEVQVMDWGLAKVLAEGGVADEARANRQHQPDEGTLVRTARSSGSAGTFGTQTEAGALLGTPAYMPPEQAIGDVALLDRRADVFGLGAILCEILTGKPPYVGRSSEEVRRKAANGDLAEATARLDACGADAELVGLTKSCLAGEASDRPKDAQAVADGLSAYLNGVQERLQTAQRERAVALAREAEQRKRRKVQLALAVAVVALLLGGGDFAFWRNAQVQAGRERDARNAEAVAALLGQAEEALMAGDAAKAAVALEAARERSAEGGAEKEAQRLGRLSADLALLRSLNAVDQFRWTHVDNKRPDPAAVATRTREALARFGADPEAVSVDDAAARLSTSVVRERIVSVLDRLLWHPKRAPVRAVLRRVDSDPYRDKVRDAVLVRDGATVLTLAGQPAALEQPVGFTAFLGAVQAIPVERRRQLLAAALSRQPGDLGLLMTLGETYRMNQEDGAAERLRWYQAAVAAFPAIPTAHNNLGIALGDKKDPAGAEAAFRKAIELDPKYAWAHNNLAVVLNSKGQHDGAIAECKMAIKVEPNLALAHNTLGTALAGKGQLDEAIACFKKAIALDPKFAGAHNNLGAALVGKERVEEAIACYQKAIELDPKDANARTGLGEALRRNGQLDEAIACLNKAIELDPKRAHAHYNLGLALSGKGEVDEAIASYRKVIEFAPNNAEAHRRLGVLFCDVKREYDAALVCFKKAIQLDPKNSKAHADLGTALRGKGQREQAVACWRKAIELDPKNAQAYSNLGAALAEKGQVDEAITSLRKAVELDPKDARAQLNLGVALGRKGQLDEAIASLEKAIALDPKNAGAHYCLGLALHSKGRVDEAIACWRKAIQLDPKNGQAHCNLALALASRGHLDLAIASFHKAIESNPKLPQAHLGLGTALADKGEVDAAIASLQKGIRLNPKEATAHYTLANALEAKGKVDEAIASYQKAIELQPRFAEAHCNLGSALQGQGRFAESLAAYRRGHALGTKQPGWPYPSAQWVREAESMADMEAKLPAFLKGEYQPKDAAGLATLAHVCRGKKLLAAAARLFADAFAADPKVADDLNAQHRYIAACSASIAAASQGDDAARLDDKERTRLRKQALDWLRADLALRSKQLEAGKPADRSQVQSTLRHWQQDSDLASVRDTAALAKLPADERKACAQLWADVAALLKKAETPAQKEGK
jgi:tetratricopeptide (TPR) repeat protein